MQLGRVAMMICRDKRESYLEKDYKIDFFVLRSDILQGIQLFLGHSTRNRTELC
jgi:hypothetical protein